VYRRVFGFRKYDSVHMFIAGIGRLDFAHLRLLSVLRFIKQEAQLMLTTGSTRLAVSRGQQT